MHKGEQPTTWGRHNLNTMAGDALQRNEERKRGQAIGEILDNPDSCEDYKIDNVTPRDQLSYFNRVLKGFFGVRLSPDFLSATVSVGLFKAHERVVDDSLALPVEVGTSVVTLDAYDPAPVVGDGAKVGSILLLKLSANLIGEPVPDMTAKDLAWGENCVYGAFVDDAARITYFEIGQTSGDVVQSELRRKDPTEESGQSVEMQFVKPGQDKLTVWKLPSSSKEAIELDQEIEKFIQSRRGAVALDEN